MPISTIGPASISGLGYGFKNRILNGQMAIDQRNAGALINPAINGNYTVDRYMAISGAASKFSIGQNAGSVTPPAGFTNYLGLTSLSAYSVGVSEVFAVRQMIEGFNIADLGWGSANAATVTLSFWVRSSLTGIFGGSLRNSAQDRSYAFSYTINSANTWEQKSITIPGDTTGTWLTNNGVGINVQFSIGSGSSVSGAAGSWAAANYQSATGATSVVGTNGATFYITGVQLEKGVVATDFDYRPYGTELALCQRYCEVFRSTTGNYSPFCSAYTINSTTGEATLQFKVEKRSAPTVTYDTASNFALAISNTGVLAVLSAISTNRVDINALAMNCTTTGLFSGGGSRLFANNTANPYIIISAEL